MNTKSPTATTAARFAAVLVLVVSLVAGPTAQAPTRTQATRTTVTTTEGV